MLRDRDEDHHLQSQKPHLVASRKRLSYEGDLQVQNHRHFGARESEMSIEKRSSSDGTKNLREDRRHESETEKRSLSNQTTVIDDGHDLTTTIKKRLSYEGGQKTIGPHELRLPHETMTGRKSSFGEASKTQTTAHQGTPVAVMTMLWHQGQYHMNVKDHGPGEMTARTRSLFDATIEKAAEEAIAHEKRSSFANERSQGPRVLSLLSGQLQDRSSSLSMLHQFTEKLLSMSDESIMGTRMH